ncbi:hypothetical protein EG799_08375 [Aurantiacibacter spongiae]|uniref:Uncharacterized protein n=1 Tax=Aurantiacibacter spongiae TaxID=2488860 RepID=A0A3N5DLH5_9SPHN|nr:hypothetical protein EG799_08375 [Aurantiacibacter spongiae]
MRQSRLDSCVSLTGAAGAGAGVGAAGAAGAAGAPGAAGAAGAGCRAASVVWSAPPSHDARARLVKKRERDCLMMRSLGCRRPGW